MTNKIFWGLAQNCSHLSIDRCLEILEKEGLQYFPSSMLETVQHSYFEDQKQGIRWWVPTDSDFPEKLLQLDDPPRVLRVQGSVPKSRLGLAVVGSREPSLLSRVWLEQVLAKTIRELNLMTVSGGARGVDSIAHAISVRLGQATLVLLPSGLRNIYPSSLLPLSELILSHGGALISEYPSEYQMRKHHFQQRNRLIPAFAEATLVVEAREKSGTMITAQQSVDQAKPLFVMPSHPLDSNSGGSLQLICDGATPVRGAEDLISFLRAEFRSAPRYGGFEEILN